MLDYMFGDEITEEQRQQIAVAVQVEDLNRGLEEGISATEWGGLAPNHTNDELDMMRARKALGLIPDELFEVYCDYQRELGYI